MSEVPGHYQQLATATVAGDGTGLINDDAQFVTVTSSANTRFVTLPSGYIGQEITGWSTANGFKFRTLSGTSGTINNVDVSGGSAGAAIPATVKFELQKVTATGWILRTVTNLGAEATAIVPA